MRVIPSGSGVRRRNRFCTQHRFTIRDTVGIQLVAQFPSPPGYLLRRQGRRLDHELVGGIGEIVRGNIRRRQPQTLLDRRCGTHRHIPGTHPGRRPRPTTATGHPAVTPTATMVRASGPEVPVTDDTNASGVRRPERCASPSCPNSRDERALTSAASRDIPESISRRASPQRRIRSINSRRHTRPARRGRGPRDRSSLWKPCIDSPKQRTQFHQSDNLWTTNRTQLPRQPISSRRGSPRRSSAPRPCRLAT